jgi:hypothetical protein
VQRVLWVKVLGEEVQEEVRLDAVGEQMRDGRPQVLIAKRKKEIYLK